MPFRPAQFGQLEEPFLIPSRDWSHKSPAWADIWTAGFQQENLAGAYYGYGLAVPPKPIGEYQENFDKLEAIPDDLYEYADAYWWARSPADAEYITERLRKQLRDRQTLQEAGIGGILPTLVAGTLDPINLPFMLLPAVGMAGRGAVRGALATAAMNVPGIVLQESALSTLQETRTGMDVFSNIAGGAILSGILGGAAGAFPAAKFNSLAKQIENDLNPTPTVRPGPTGNIIRGGAGETLTAKEAIDSGLRTGALDEGTYQQFRALTELDPDIDANTVIEIHDAVRIAKENELYPEMEPPKDGTTARILGATEVEPRPDAPDLTRIAIRIYRGADADTVTEEWYHRFWKRSLTPEQRKAFEDYHAASGDPRTVEEHFAQEGRDFFFKERLYKETGPIQSLFRDAKAALLDLIARIVKLRGANVPENIRQIYIEAGSPVPKPRAAAEATAEIPTPARAIEPARAPDEPPPPEPWQQKLQEAKQRELERLDIERDRYRVEFQDKIDPEQRDPSHPWWVRDRKTGELKKYPNKKLAEAAREQLIEETDHAQQLVDDILSRTVGEEIERGEYPDVFESTVSYQIRSFSEERDVDAPHITERILNAKPISESDIKQWEQIARDAGLSQTGIDTAVQKFRDYNEIRKIGTVIIAAIPDEIAQQDVVARLGVLNTPGLLGKRWDRTEQVLLGVTEGKATVPTGAIVPEGRSRTTIPKKIRGLRARPFLNVPITQPDLSKVKPAHVKYPIMVTGNPHIVNFRRPHPSWDENIKVVRVKPVLNGSAAAIKAVTSAINYANEIGAKILITTFRSKQLWTLARFTDIVPTDPSHPEFSKYWRPNKISRNSVDPRKLPDWVPYTPRKAAKDAIKANGWNTEKSIYGKGGTWYWPNTRELDQRILEGIDPNTKVEYCDLLHKGCTACRNCQKLTYPDSAGAPIVGITDEPFCEHGCPQCFVRLGQSGIKGRLGISIGQNAKQGGFGQADLGDIFKETIPILQRAARDAGRKGVAQYVSHWFYKSFNEQMDMAMSLFLDGQVTPDEFLRMQNEVLDYVEKKPAMDAALAAKGNKAESAMETNAETFQQRIFKDLASIPAGINPNDLVKPDWIPDWLWKPLARVHPGLDPFTYEYIKKPAEWMVKLVETPEYLWKNLAGERSPDSIESLIKRERNVYTWRLRSAIWVHYSNYVSRIKKQNAQTRDLTDVSQLWTIKEKLSPRGDEQQFKKQIYDVLQELSSGKKSITNLPLDGRYEPEAIAAAKEIGGIVNEIGKRLQAVGLLPEKMKEALGAGYIHMPRVWNLAAVQQYRRDLIELLDLDWERNNPFAPQQGILRRPPTPEELEQGIVSIEEDIVVPEPKPDHNQAVDKIMHSPTGYLGVEIASDNPLEAGTARFLEDRALDIDSRKLSIPERDADGNVIKNPDGSVRYISFVETDPERYLESYFSSTLPDLMLAERNGGDITLKNLVDEIANEAQEKLATVAGNTKAYNQIISERDRGIKRILAMRDLLRGDYHPNGKPDPTAIPYRAHSMVITVNSMIYLGGMTASSFGDIVRPIWHWGLSPYAKALRQYSTLPPEYRKAFKREVFGVWGAIGDVTLSTRVAAITDLKRTDSLLSKPERAVQFLGNHLGLFTGMDWWNTQLKMLAIYAGNHTVMDIAQRVKSLGVLDMEAARTAGLDTGLLAQIARMGLGLDDLHKIADQLEQWGEKFDDKLYLPRVDKWTDLELAGRYKSAMTKEADELIVTPGVGDRPLWMHTQTGKIISQFKAYPMSSMRKIFIQGFQRQDSKLAVSILFSTLMGGAVTAFKAWERGDELPDDLGEWLYNAIDRAGMTGYFFDADKYLELLSGNTLGVSPMLGLGQAQRLEFQKDLVDLALGPTGSTLKNATTAVSAPFRAALGDGLTRQDIDAYFRLLFYSKVTGPRWVFERMRQLARETIPEDE